MVPSLISLDWILFQFQLNYLVALYNLQLLNFFSMNCRLYNM